MKKITLLAGALLMSLATFAQVTITHSSDPATVDSGIVCSNDEPSGINAHRVFDLGGEFDITNDFVTESVQWGVNSLLGGVDYEVTLRLSALTGDILGAPDLTEIASETVIIQEADTGILFTTPLVATIPAGTVLVFSLELPNDGVTFPAAGANLAAQTSPSYANGSCLADVTDIADFGLTQSWTMNVVGSEALGTNDVALSQVSLFPNPASDVLNIKVPSSIELTGVTLYDVLGKAANVSVSNNQVNVANLSRGVYIVNIETNAGTLTEKLVIE